MVNDKLWSAIAFLIKFTAPKYSLLKLSQCLKFVMGIPLKIFGNQFVPFLFNS